MPSSDEGGAVRLAITWQVIERISCRMWTSGRDAPDSLGPWQTIRSPTSGLAPMAHVGQIHARLVAETDAAGQLEGNERQGTRSTGRTRTPPP